MPKKIKGFYKLSIGKRLEFIKKSAKLTKDEVALLKKTGALDIKTADMMIENVVGTTELPYGIAVNFTINGKPYLIPMVLEEPSVVAAASYAAKLADSFTTSSDEPVMIGQIQIIGLKGRKLKKARKKILKNKEEIKKVANNQDSTLIKFGGGVRDIEARIIKTKKGRMLIVHLIVDVRDAMGANAINTMAEAISPYLEELTGGKTRLRIISNLADRRLARAKAVWSREKLGDLVDGIIEAYEFAKNDVYRCATHNKGIMNGIDAVAIATGNDFRALEAGAHSFAANNKGSYQPLTKYEKDKEGNLVGSIELPLAVGIVGGATRTHPIAKISLKILGVKNAQELAEVMACVGLANNFAALRALAKEGIQRGHMELHASNIAVIAGAKGKLIDRVAKKLIKERRINVARAREWLRKLRRRK